MKTFIITLCTLSAFTSYASEYLKILNKEDNLNLKVNKQVVKEIKSPKGAWPIIRLYQVVDASPLESMAIFFALDHQKNYIPNLLRSDIHTIKSATEIWVDYEMDMPWPLSNVQYLHGHKLKRTSDENYHVNWWMIESTSTEKVEGLADFQRLPSGKTLMVYQNYVIPKSFLATFLKGTMINDVKVTLKAIKQEIEVSKGKKIMNKYKNIILESLKGKVSYKITKENNK